MYISRDEDCLKWSTNNVSVVHEVTLIICNLPNYNHDNKELRH